MQEKVIILDKFYAGIASVDLDKDSNPGECGYAQEMNLINNEGFLTPNLEMTDDADGDTSTVGSRLEGFAVSATTQYGSNVSLWAVAYYLDTNYKNRVIQKTSHNGTWTAVGTATAGVNNTNITDADMEPWCIQHDDYIYWPSRSTGSSQVLARHQISGATTTETWDTINTAAWGSTNYTLAQGGAMVHTDGNAYFWKGRYIGVYDGTTAPSATTPFALPSKYRIKDAIPYRNKILIAANHQALTETSKLFLLDPYAPGLLYTFDDIYETNFYNIRAIRIVEGGVKVITATGDYVISDWVGGDYIIPSRVIPVATTSPLSMYRTAVDVRRNTMYFGTDNQVSGMNGGVYTYGRATNLDPWAVSNEHINHSADVSSVTYRHAKWWNSSTGGSDVKGDERLYVNWWDNTSATANFRISQLTTTKADGVFETVWFRPYPGLKSQIRKMTIYTEAIPASCSFVIKEQVDGQSAVTIATISTQNAVKTVIGNNRAIISTVSADTVTTPTAAFQKGWKHKIRIEFTSNSTNAVEIEKIKLRVATEDVE